MRKGTTAELQEFLKSVENRDRAYEQIIDILLEFDFERVEEAMKAVNWDWAFWTDEEGEVHTNEPPSLYALQAKAKELLLTCISIGSGISTGGFETDIEFYPDAEPNEKVQLGLRFVLAESH